MENRNELEIQASSEEVWAVLTDMGKHADWNPLIVQAEGRIEVGHLVKVRAKTASRAMKFDCRVVKVEPTREFQWHWFVALPFLLKGEHMFRIVPVDENSVRFIDREILKGILVPFMRKEFETSSKDAMAAMGMALKNRVETLSKQHNSLPTGKEIGRSSANGTVR